MRQRARKNGFTVFQLLVSIIVVVIIGALWGAYNQHQQMKEAAPALPKKFGK